MIRFDLCCKMLQLQIWVSAGAVAVIYTALLNNTEGEQFNIAQNKFTHTHFSLVFFYL